jgi:hypothetical protein
MADGPLSALSSRAIKGMFYRAMESEFDAGWATRIAMGPFPSDQLSENYNWLGMPPAFREWVGGRQAKQLNKQAFEIKNVHYETTIDIDNRDHRLDKTGQISMRIGDLVKRSRSHWEKLLSTLLLAGETGDCYDGKKFFAADHSEGSSGTLKNLLTATEVPELDVTTATAPTQDEMSKAILGVIGYMLTYLDDQGEPIHGDAMEWIVMAGSVSIWQASLNAVKANQLSSASGAVDNVLTNSPFKIGAILNPRLSAWTDDFVVARVDGNGKAFILQEETPLTMRVKEGGNYEFDHDAKQYGVDGWRAAGYGMWQDCAKATLS